MIYKTTVTKQTCHPMEYDHKFSTVALQETHNKQGQALLWIKQWVKTRGVNRTMQRRGKGRVVHPPEYAVLEMGAQIDFFGTEDWNWSYRPGMLDNLFSHVGAYNRDLGLDAYHSEWGLRIASIYSLKRVGEWESLWIRVDDDNGNEYIEEKNNGST